MELPFSQFSTKLYNFSWQHLLITYGCDREVGSDSTLMMSFSMTSQHSWGQTIVHTVSSVCDHLAHLNIPDTDASLMPLGWHGMLVVFLAKLLAGLRQVLAAWLSASICFKNWTEQLNTKPCCHAHESLYCFHKYITHVLPVHMLTFGTSFNFPFKWHQEQKGVKIKWTNKDARN